MNKFFENGLLVMIAIVTPFVLISLFFFAYAPNRVQKHQIHAVKLESGLHFF